jgi:DNA-binding CsgD family transcriptional regulator/tetratricopeptide (TPR) repeat protein
VVGLRLAGALGEFWYARGYYEEGKRWLERALAKDGRAPAAAHAKALVALGWLAQERGDLGRAEAAAEEGLELSAQVGIESTRKASFLRILGTTARIRGDLEQTKERYEKSLALSREAEDRVGVAHSLVILGWAADVRGDHEQGMRLYEVALTISRELGGAQPLGDSLIALGYEYLLEGDHEQATALNEEAASLFRERGHRGLLPYALDNLAWAALLRGDHERARKLHEESLVLCRELGDITIAAESLEGLACGAGARGEAKRAAKLFGAAEALREAVGYWQESRERALREPYLVAARSQLDEAIWEVAFAEGYTMGLEGAFRYAISDEESATPISAAPEQSSAGAKSLNLSPREKEVAVLVAKELSNRQIALQLMLSEHTVATHIRNILKKLGLRSRTQVAAYSTEHRPPS